MRYEIEECGLVIDMPEGFDASYGSVFGDRGIEFAMYRENTDETPGRDSEYRRDIIEGRSPVEGYLREELLPDGWLTTFRTDDDCFGFEIGRHFGEERIVFWGDRSPDADILDEVIGFCLAATKE